MDSSQSAALGGNGTLISQTNDVAASTAGADDSMQKLNQVSNSIQKTLGLIHQLYLTVSTFNAAFQMPLLQRINGLVMELDNMVKLAEKCNIQVPMEVVNLIDDGKNPDEFTRDVLNNCIAKNQITKGKTDALKGFRKHLLEELEQNFPDEVETFRESRVAAAAEFKRLAQAQSSLPNGDVRREVKISISVIQTMKCGLKIFTTTTQWYQFTTIIPSSTDQAAGAHLV
ncbi:Mediator of RNA polymerase II transcription subunit 10b, partial [Mucuna pruriens]